MGVFNLNMANKNIARFSIFNDTGILYNLALFVGFVSGTVKHEQEVGGGCDFVSGLSLECVCYNLQIVHTQCRWNMWG